MPFFPLPNTVEIHRDTKVVARSGQSTQTWAKVLQPICLFYSTSGSREHEPREDFRQIAEVYFEPSVDIREGDRIYNVRDRKGVVTEAGPFLVRSIRKIFGFDGKVHHITCKVNGVSV